MNEKPKPAGPVFEHAMAHMTIAAHEMASTIQPAEMAALERLHQVEGGNMLSAMLGMIVGFLSQKGLSPEDIGDATTALARIVQQ